MRQCPLVGLALNRSSRRALPASQSQTRHHGAHHRRVKALAALGRSPALCIEHVCNGGVGSALPVERRQALCQLRVVAELIQACDWTGDRGRRCVAAPPVDLDIDPLTVALHGGDDPLDQLPHNRLAFGRCGVTGN